MARKQPPKPGTTDLQIKDFPEKLKQEVQARALLSGRTFKQLTIELYEAYLSNEQKKG